MKFALTPLAACLAAAFGLTPLNILAAPPAPPPVQTQNPSGTQQGTGTPTATVPPVLATRPMTSVFPAQPREFPGIAWGSFLVFPDVSLAATYDDNIYAERTDVVEDMVYTLSPSIEFKSKWTQHALNFGLGADFDRYRNNDSEDVNDYWLDIDGRYDISPRTNVFGGARHARDHEDRSTPGALNPGAQTEPTRYDHDEAHLGVAHAFGAFRLHAGGTWDRYDYKDGVSTLGAVDNDYRDPLLSG